MNKRQKLYEELKGILKFTPPTDGLVMLASKKLSIDVIKLDKMIQQRNPDYNSDKCMYKDQKDVSMSKAVTLIYGERATEIIRELI